MNLKDALELNTYLRGIVKVWMMLSELSGTVTLHPSSSVRTMAWLSSTKTGILRRAKMIYQFADLINSPS
jgi:hypothetical protein